MVLWLPHFYCYCKDSSEASTCQAIKLPTHTPFAQISPVPVLTDFVTEVISCLFLEVIKQRHVYIYVIQRNEFFTEGWFRQILLE